MKAVIIEDELIIAKQLARKVNELANDVEIVSILSSLETAQKWFSRNPEPDLLFMDIQLSDGVSFDLFEQFEITCPVIFTSAYNEYAIKAFKKNGIDYLLKPIVPRELESAISKCRKLIHQSHEPQENIQRLLEELGYQPPSGSRQRFIVRHRNQLIPVNVKEIAFFSHDHLNYLVNFKREKYIMNTNTLDEIEAQLDPHLFYRANRQHVVQIKAIESVKTMEDGRLLIKLIPPLTEEIEVSRKKAADFRKWLDR